MSTLPLPRAVAVMTAVAVTLGPSTAIAQVSDAPPRPPTASAPATAPASPERGVIAAFTRADRDEVLMARAALPTLRDAEVKRYAQRMIDDHTAHLTATNAIATRLGVTPMPDSGATSQTAATTDAGYIDAAVAAHQQLLAQLPTDGNTIQDQGLRQHLADTRRTAQAHLDEAIRLKAKLAGRAP